jgi:purine-binding chemotaxis protein CheW
VNTQPVQKVDPTTVRATLRARARQLATPPEVEDSAVRLVEIVEFTLGQEHYAFPSSEVREVFRISEITPLPSLPPFVLGVTNVRGRVLSVIDIRKMLEFGTAGLTNLNRAIILSGAEMELAVLADEVLGVYASDADKWQSALPTLGGKREEYLKGVTKERVVVLDAKKLLESEDLLVGGDSL